jgi:hypothetical protein
MKSQSPLFAKLRDPLSASRKEGFMDRDRFPADAAPMPAHPELWGGLERDLSRLQGLMDQAVEQMRDAFSRISARVDAGQVPAAERELIGAEIRRILTSFQFHDIASQMIVNMRSRAALLELAALVAMPGQAADEHARLLEQAAQLTRRCPDENWNDQGGDVELF